MSSSFKHRESNPPEMRGGPGRVVDEQGFFLRAALERIDLGIVECDTSGRITFFNQTMQKIHGIPDSAISPELWPEYFGLHQSDGKTLLAPEEVPLFRALKGEFVSNQEVVVISKGRSPRNLLVSGQPISDEGGNLRGAIIVAHDVTNMERTQEQLRQAQKMEAIGQLAGAVAHDFNNILMAISGYSELMMMDPATSDPVKFLASEVYKAVERGSSLTRQLLAFSRKQASQPKILDLNQVLAGMEELLRRLLKADVDLRLSMDPALGKVKVDASQIEQVIMNLAVNARDAMPRGGRLTIETTNTLLDDSYNAGHLNVKSGEYVLLTVSDNGIGMDQATQARIFEPFFTTKEEGHGTGLGLSTVYGTIKQNDGFIWVYSEPGQGSTFKIYLPRVDASMELPALPCGPNLANGSGSETILLVDDNESVRGAFSALLEAFGYTVLRAASGREALKAAMECEKPIDVMVTDLVMPGIGGQELAQILERDHKVLNVIYMSGYTGEAASRQGILDPSATFLQKPATINQLLAKIRELLDSREA